MARDRSPSYSRSRRRERARSYRSRSPRHRRSPSRIRRRSPRRRRSRPPPVDFRIRDPFVTYQEERGLPPRHRERSPEFVDFANVAASAQRLHQLMSSLHEDTMALSVVQNNIEVSYGRLEEGKAQYDFDLIEHAEVQLKQLCRQEKSILTDLDDRREQLTHLDAQFSKMLVSADKTMRDVIGRKVPHARKPVPFIRMTDLDRQDWQHYNRLKENLNEEERRLKENVEQSADQHLESNLSRYQEVRAGNKRLLRKRLHTMREMAGMSSSERKMWKHWNDTQKHSHEKQRSFVLNKELIANTECPVCLDVKEASAVVYPCLHAVCDECIQHFRHAGAECPTCRAEIQKSKIVDNKPYDVHFRITEQCIKRFPINWNSGDQVGATYESDESSEDCIITGGPSSSSHEAPPAPASFFKF